MFRVRQNERAAIDETVDTGPVGDGTGSHAGQPCGSQGRTGMIGEQLNRHTQYVGRDLHPHAARGAPVRGEDATHRIADILQHINMVTKAEDGPFKKGAPEVPDVVAEA